MDQETRYNLTFRVVPVCRLMQNSSLESEPWASIGATPSHGASPELPSFTKTIIEAAVEAAEILRTKTLPSEDDALKLAIAPGEKIDAPNETGPIAQAEKARDLVISFRAAISGLMVSFVDSAPSEIAVATFKNMNAIATWDTQRATDSTIYITVTSVQVDNMVPNAPFPVAICSFDQPRNAGTDTTATSDSPPMLVIGLSLAPRHKSGIVVSDYTGVI